MANHAQYTHGKNCQMSIQMYRIEGLEHVITPLNKKGPVSAESTSLPSCRLSSLQWQSCKVARWGSVQWPCWSRQWGAAQTCVETFWQWYCTSATAAERATETWDQATEEVPSVPRKKTPQEPSWCCTGILFKLGSITPYFRTLLCDSIVNTATKLAVQKSLKKCCTLFHVNREIGNPTERSNTPYRYYLDAKLAL